ncbi:hypothetical protein Ancab_029883 [Ancistrocladus abbreviatus]
MAALEHILSHSRRIPRSQFSLFLHRPRPFSSESNPQSPPSEPAKQNNVEPVPIQPVSYAVKPKQPPSSDEEEKPLPPSSSRRQPLRPGMDSAKTQSPRSDVDSARTWTREDIRFVKDAPVIFPVSYPKKVAPLPEDRVASTAEVEEKGENLGELERERRKIEAGNRTSRKFFMVVEEEKEVPFPRLIKVENKQTEKKIYDLQEAIRQVKANAKRNFNETVEAHVNLGIDRRRSDLGVSGAVVLPHGTGKNVRVAVFAEGAAAEEARVAGADIVGADELIQEIRNGGKINFDKCIATHSMMQRVAGISKILRGLTPNTKKGTVTNDVAAAVKEAKQGLLDFKMKDSIVHVGLGKVTFSEESLRENIGAFVNALLLAKPLGLKKNGSWISSFNTVIIQSCRSLYQITSTMIRCFGYCVPQVAVFLPYWIDWSC